MAMLKKKPTRSRARAERAIDPEPTKTERHDTMGFRIQQALDDAKPKLTQAAAAKALGYFSHASISNWIHNITDPPREAIVALAKLTGKSVVWLEHGIDGKPVEVEPPAEKMGYAIVPEVIFGDDIADRKEVHKWGLPVDFLKELQIVDTKLAIVYRVSNPAGKHEYGDRVLIDGSQRKPQSGAEYLYWHGNAPAIGQVSVPLASPGKKASVKVKTFAYGGEEETHEVEADKLQIIGRLKGTWRRS